MGARWDRARRRGDSRMDRSRPECIAGVCSVGRRISINKRSQSLNSLTKIWEFPQHYPEHTVSETVLNLFIS